MPLDFAAEPTLTAEQLDLDTLVELREAVTRRLAIHPKWTAILLDYSTRMPGGAPEKLPVTGSIHTPALLSRNVFRHLHQLSLEGKTDRGNVEVVLRHMDFLAWEARKGR